MALKFQAEASEELARLDRVKLNAALDEEREERGRLQFERVQLQNRVVEMERQKPEHFNIASGSTEVAITKDDEEKAKDSQKSEREVFEAYMEAASSAQGPGKSKEELFNDYKIIVQERDSMRMAALEKEKKAEEKDQRYYSIV